MSRPLACATATADAAWGGVVVSSTMLAPASSRAVTAAVRSASVGWTFCATISTPSSAAAYSAPASAFSP
jgi:hypothetical protein